LSFDWDNTPEYYSAMQSLRALIRELPSVLLGYSGGVDSALLAVVLRQELGRERMLAGWAASGCSP